MPTDKKAAALPPSGTTTLRFFEKLTTACVYAFVLSYTVSKAMIEVSFTVGLISWLITKIIKKGFLRLPWSGMLGALALFVGLSVSSAFVSQYMSQSIHGIGKHLEEVLFFIIIADTFRSRKKIRKLLLMGLAVLVVTALDAVFQLGTGRDFLRGRAASYVDDRIRLVGPFKEHSAFASYLIGWLTILLAFFLNPDYRSARNKVLMAIVLALGGLCLFHTQARGAWLAFAFSILFFSVIQKKKLLLGVLLVSVAAGLLILPRNMIIHPDAEGKEQSMVERLVLWDRAVDVIKARPWLGTGINTYAVAHQQFDKEKSWRVKNYYAHNSFLQLAADRGLPALFSFLAFIVLFFRQAFLVIRKTGDPERSSLLQGVMTGLTGLFALSLVDTVFEPLQTGMLLWFLFGLGFAAMYVNGEEKGA